MVHAGPHIGAEGWCGRRAGAGSCLRRGQSESAGGWDAWEAGLDWARGGTGSWGAGTREASGWPG